MYPDIIILDKFISLASVNIIGASPSTGIICETTKYGSAIFSAIFDKLIIIANTNPTNAPRANPINALERVRPAALIKSEKFCIKDIMTICGYGSLASAIGSCNTPSRRNAVSSQRTKIPTAHTVLIMYFSFLLFILIPPQSCFLSW